MAKGIAAVTAFFAVVATCALLLGAALEGDSGIHRIEPTSPCPVVGCVSESCHGYDAIPEPDGVHEMICPEVGCASTSCHAWETLQNRYHQASSTSLMLWILAPVVFVIALLFMMGLFKGSKSSTGSAREGKQAVGEFDRPADLGGRSNGEGREIGAEQGAAKEGGSNENR